MRSRNLRAWALVVALASCVFCGNESVAQSASNSASPRQVATGPKKAGARIVMYWQQAPINQLIPGLVPKWMSGRADIEVNGKVAARLGWGEVVTVPVPPGTNYVRQDIGINLFGLKGMPVKVGAGQTVYLQAYKEQYNLFFRQVSSATAARDMAEIKKYR